MPIQGRRERDRAHRERLIVTAARDLAEAEGWDAVTTRRLAELIEYSQPVLYSHFTGKDAIRAAVAADGFGELAVDLRVARSGARTARAGLIAVASAYLDFAERRPALYDAMFLHAVDLPFASPHTPAPLQEAFGALRAAIRPLAGGDGDGNGDDDGDDDGDDVDVLTEVLWAGLHGLTTLMTGGRLPRENHERRVALLLSHFADYADHAHRANFAG
jgi:AcrR family transcriptional regulator